MVGGFKGDNKEVMKQTREFLSCDTSKNAFFWRFIKEFYKELGEKLENHFASVAYNNVRRVCFNKDKGKNPKKSLGDMEYAFNGLLLEELKIIQPKIVLFLTGPNYDKFIQKQLQGVESCNIASNPPLPHKLKKVKELTHKDLPNALMLRIYNPRHYYFQPKQNRIQYLKVLIEVCKDWLDKQSH